MTSFKTKIDNLTRTQWLRSSFQQWATTEIVSISASTSGLTSGEYEQEQGCCLTKGNQKSSFWKEAIPHATGSF